MSIPEVLKQVAQEELRFISQCPICGEDRTQGKKVVTLQDQPETVTMITCPACHASSAEAMPSAAHLEKVYDPAHYSATLTNLPGLTRVLCQRLVKQFNLNSRTRLKVLDYGGGNGMLARELVKQLQEAYPQLEKVQATVVDLFPEPGEPGLEFIHVNDFLASRETYDIVVASAVLEHIPDLGDILKRLLSCGSSGALFYARCPYEVPLAAHLGFYRINWPVHVHDIGPDFWQQLAEKSHGSVRIKKSQTSIVETTFRHAPGRTLAAYILKAPSRLETGGIRKWLGYKKHLWPYVGGWEVFLELYPPESA